MTAEEPAMLVSAAATRPPVQDSAVTTIRCLDLHRSSRAVALLPNSSSSIAGETPSDYQLQGRRTVAVAIAAIPSPRPVKPIFSLVVEIGRASCRERVSDTV